ncbi:MAG TPA: hypothetical protein DDY43_03375 [Synechococcales bacterium UBA10510]|nr:hypothetical protein [Synechococcales bacterium UBA10510]
MMRLRQAKARCRSRKRRIQARACRWLHQAVINFVNRWRTGKQRFEQLTARQQALRASLEGSVLEDSRAGSTVQQLSILPEPSQEPADGQDR